VAASTGGVKLGGRGRVVLGFCIVSDGGGRASPAVELSRSLLDAKLTIPEHRNDAVSRRTLIDAARESDRRVVGITAPAGYGKSTLLAEWAQIDNRPVGWVSFDRFDDDPSTFLYLLASAYGRVSPTDSDLLGEMSGIGVSVLGRAAPRLASALRASPTPFVLMLDDLHEVNAAGCHDALGIVIDGIPRGSQLVAASRAEQPHIPRLRTSGEVMEVGTDDLAFDADGARQVFSGAQVEIDPDAAVAVAARTEGWPVGLYLAALIARDGDGGHAASSVTGDDRYVADYLYRESMARLPEERQRFLRRTAVLDQLTASLCDAVVGEPGSGEHLRALEASNSFLVPLDRRRGWYRYHALFREFLLAELRRFEPDEVMKLHLRAADWYEANGSAQIAVEHLLDTNERDRCVQLVTSLILPIYLDGQMSTAIRWLETLGNDTIDGYPPLVVLAGWIAALSGQVVETERLTAVLDTASFDQVPADGSASFASARAMLLSMVCATGADKAVADAELALASEPAWSPWRNQAVCLAAEAALLVGDTGRSVDLFGDLFALGVDSDAVVLGRAQLALIDMSRERWSDAAEHVEAALSMIERHHMQDYSTSALAFAAAARLALHRSDREGAEGRLTEAMRARIACTPAVPAVAVRVRLHLAKAYWSMGDQPAARHLLREIDEVLRVRPDLGVLVGEVTEFRDAMATASPSGAAGPPPLSPAELRLLPYMQTHLTFNEIAARLFVSRNTVSSQASSIYRKLGVSSRNGAVSQATAIGLIGG
jgi:LuxR family maltose regulon positive regulatory protein